MSKWVRSPYSIFIIFIFFLIFLTPGLPYGLLHANNTNTMVSCNSNVTIQRCTHINAITVDISHNLYATGSLIYIHGNVFSDNKNELDHIPIIIRIDKIQIAPYGNPQFGWNKNLNHTETVAILQSETRKDGSYNSTTMVEDGGE